MGRRPATLSDRLPADLGPTLQLAAVLAGSTRGAADLVAEALATERPRAGDDDGSELTPELRVSLVRTFLAAPLGRSTPPINATGLDALTGPVRAEIALRDGEQLTTGEIATIVDRPGKRVAADLAAVPPGACDVEIAELRALAPSVDLVSSRLLPAVRAVRRSRRRRTGLLAVATLAVLAAVVVPTVVLPRLPAEVRQAGTWRYSHEVRLAPDWQLVTQTIEPGQEQTVVRVPWGVDDPADCTVTVRVAGLLPDRPRGRVRPTSLQGRPAEIVTRPGNFLRLSWEYAQAAWASVECESQSAVSAGVLRNLAAAVRFRDRRQLLPFTLTGLPEGYRIAMVSESFAPVWGRVWGPTVLIEPPENSYQAAIIVGPDLSSSDGSSFGPTGSCLEADRSVCVFAFQTDDQVPPNRGMLRLAVAATIDDLQVAADPEDRSTWFDAITLPG